MDLNFRIAEEKDLWALMALYQKVGSTFTEDPLFLDYEKLCGAVTADDSVWLITETWEKEILAVVSILLDREQGIAKMSRMMINPDPCPELKDTESNLQRSIRHAVSYLLKREPTIDVIYSTTLTLPLHLQEVTLREGFQILGVFPNALGVDQSQLNGITVRYREGVLRGKRNANFSIHEAIAPFFSLAKKALDLPSVEKTLDTGVPDSQDFEPVPPLEIVRAPLLVERKFEDLRAHQSQIVNFYPFLHPNALICDPGQKIEIYIKIVDYIRFAAIIGEYLERSVEPSKLYSQILKTLRAQNVSYVEVINDAADVYGTQCFLDAGFTPSAYIPAFKRQGDSRRDYIVFGKSFEYLCRPAARISKGYLDFFKQYYRLERRNYFGARVSTTT